MRRYLPPATALILVIGYVLFSNAVPVTVLRMAWLVAALGMFAGVVMYHQWITRSYFRVLQQNTAASLLRNDDGTRDRVAWPDTNPFLNALFTGYARSPFPDMHGRRVAGYSKNWLSRDRVEVAEMLSNPDLDGHTIRLLCERALIEVQRHPYPKALIDGRAVDADRMLIEAVGVAVTVFPWEFSPEFVQQARALVFLDALTADPRR